MINRYHGNTGRVERIPEPPRVPPPDERPPRPEPGRGGSDPFGVSALLRRFSRSALEPEDLLLLLVVYLLYRESGDRELLIALGALLFL